MHAKERMEARLNRLVALFSRLPFALLRATNSKRKTLATDANARMHAQEGGKHTPMGEQEEKGHTPKRKSGAQPGNTNAPRKAKGAHRYGFNMSLADDPKIGDLRARYIARARHILHITGRDPTQAEVIYVARQDCYNALHHAVDLPPRVI